MRYVYQRLTCTNDRNGNPRRLIVVYDLDDGGKPTIMDEGYAGAGRSRLESEGFPGGMVEILSVEITAGQYRAMLPRVRRHHS